MMAERNEKGAESGVSDTVSNLTRSSTLTDNVGPLLSHVDQISSRSVGELDSVDGSLRSNDVGDVGDGGSRGGSEVEDLLSGGDVDLVETSEDTSGELGSERVPDSVLGLDLHTVLSRGGDGDSLRGGKGRERKRSARRKIERQDSIER